MTSNAGEKSAKTGATSGKDSQPTSPLGIVAGLAALGFLLVVIFFRSGPNRDLPVDQRALAMAIIQQMSTDGILMDYACAENQAFVNKPLWDRLNPDQKRSLTMNLAAACDNQHAGYRMTIVDVESKQHLASFDGQSFKIP